MAVPLSLVPDAWYLEHMWRHVGIGSSSLQTWSASIAALVSKHMFSHVLVSPHCIDAEQGIIRAAAATAEY